MTDSHIETTDIAEIARRRLADGRHISDADVAALIAQIERLRRLETAVKAKRQEWLVAQTETTTSQVLADCLNAMEMTHANHRE
jgi:hypothetical protein